MSIEIRQLNIRSSFSDPEGRDGEEERRSTHRALERQKREIVAELKLWLEGRLTQDRER